MPPPREVYVALVPSMVLLVGIFQRWGLVGGFQIIGTVKIFFLLCHRHKVSTFDHYNILLL